MPARPTRVPRVSIVIRAFNEEKHLGNLLDAIARQTLRDHEIILVDSGSTDSTLAIAARYPVRVVNIKPGEFTFGRSLNMGLRAGRGAVSVLASAHVLPMDEDWLANLVAPFADRKMALAYGMQRGGEGSKFSEDQHFRRWYPERSDPDQEQPFANNANLALSTALWRKHPFDETLTGLEDLAWASHMRELGYKIAYVAEAGVLHLHDESAAQIVNRHRREAIALKRILPASKFSLRDFASQYVRSVASDLRAARRQRVLLRELFGILSFRFLQYYGTYRGYRDPQKPGSELTKVFYYPPGSLEEREPADVKGARRKSAKV